MESSANARSQALPGGQSAALAIPLGGRQRGVEKASSDSRKTLALGDICCCEVCGGHEQRHDVNCRTETNDCNPDPCAELLLRDGGARAVSAAGAFSTAVAVAVAIADGGDE